MAISANEVKHVASLAKLEFSDAKLQKFTGQMDQIINMVQQLSEVDTTDVPVTTTVTDAFNVMREDIAVKGTDRELLMENVPERKDGFIKVPAIIDESEEGQPMDYFTTDLTSLHEKLVNKDLSVEELTKERSVDHGL